MSQQPAIVQPSSYLTRATNSDPPFQIESASSKLDTILYLSRQKP